MKFNRRDFLQLSGLAIGGSMVTLSCKTTPPGYYFFTSEEALCMIAICEQIVPADEDPGATDAGCIYYIDNQLNSYFSNQKELYRNGLAAIQTYCNKTFGKNFEKLPFTEQTEILKLLEQGNLKGDEWSNIQQAVLFKNFLDHTMQGYYGSPRHGGNRYYVSYKMMGLEYPQVIGQNRYKTI